MAVGVAGLLVVGGVAGWGGLGAMWERVLAWVDGLGVWGPVVFVGVYGLSAVLMVPGSVLTLGAGALFGVVWGTVYVSAGSTLGAVAAFLVGRHLARERVAGWVEGRELFRALDRAVGEEGWRVVLLARLSPVFPYNLLNYFFGLTRVSLGGYAVASWLGMLPATVVYVWVGSVARWGVGDGGRSGWEWGLYGVGLVATEWVVVRVAGVARRALEGKVKGVGDAGGDRVTGGGGGRGVA